MRITSLLFLVSMLYSCSTQQKAASSSESALKLQLFYPVNPLLTFSNQNPVLQLQVSVPAGHQAIKLTGLDGKFNNSGASVRSLEVYYSGNDRVYRKDSLLATFQPEEEGIQIPVAITLNPGIHYFWINALLKDDADMDKRISMTVSRVHTEAIPNLTPENIRSTDQYTGIALRKAWDDEVHTYRIPGIITTDNGTLISVYDIRYKHSGDLPANIDVGMSRSTDGGRTWEPMKIIMDMGPPHENNGIGDPSVLFDPVTKKVWVAALWSYGNNSIRDSRPGLSPDSSGQFVLVSSDDYGVTWSDPINITAQVKNPKWHLYFNGPGNGIVMQNGTLVFPSQYWDESKKPGIPHSSIIYSEDNGKTWKSGIGAKSNTTEAQVVETTPGTLMLNMRDNRGRYRSVATTSDMGKTWTEHHTSTTALQDPVCMASFIRANVQTAEGLKDVLFFSNVNSQTARKDMTIKASMDLGESWPDKHGLLLDERGTYGYSALTRIDAETIGILYEGIRDLYFVRIPVKDILNQ